jgi:hypothetical protein
MFVMLKKVCIAVLALGLILCGCAKETEPEEIQTQTAEETVLLVEETTQPSVTEPVPTEPPTEPPTKPPRIPGPQRQEGAAALIENVTVEYAREISQAIRSSTTYSACGFREELELNDSQVYAVIRFTLTNKTAGEMEVADIHDDFLVELIYDNRYVYSPDRDSWCVFQAGPQVAVVSDSASVGKVTLAPLSTKEVAVYIPCAREVSEAVEKNLDVVFSSTYSGYETYNFVIR